MPTLPPLAYPSSEDIRYGLWLKRFATQLPAYAELYSFSALQLLEIQSIAGEYLDLLIWHLQHGRTHQPLAAADFYPVAGTEISCHEYAHIVQALVAKFIAYVQQHPAHTARNGRALLLNDIPYLSY